MSSNDFSTRNLRDIKKLIKEFLADLEDFRPFLEMNEYDDVLDKKKEKWEKRLAESGSGGDFRY